MADREANAPEQLSLTAARAVQVVLVETSHAGNIGAVARAMKNMGLENLALVSPAEFPSDVATRRASGADDVLANAAVFDSLDAAIAQSTLVVGASARTRHLVWPLINPRALAGKVIEHLPGEVGSLNAPSISIVFGRESSGLTNDELQKCQYHVNIPANPDYASLNLAMAVQVISYELRMACLGMENKAVSEPECDAEAVKTANAAGADASAGIEGPADDGWDEPPATAREVEGLLTHLEQTLVTAGFHDPDKPRMLMARLRRLIFRAQPDKMEVNIVRGMLKAFNKRLNGEN